MIHTNQNKNRETYMTETVALYTTLQLANRQEHKVKFSHSVRDQYN